MSVTGDSVFGPIEKQSSQMRVATASSMATQTCAKMVGYLTTESAGPGHLSENRKYNA